MKQAIDKLLEKYYDGETTLEEEKQLREFFQQPSIPPHLQSHAGQFRYFSDARKEHPSLLFSSQLADKLKPPGRLTIVTNWARQLAASVLLLLVGFAGGHVYNQWRANPSGIASLGSTSPTTSALDMKKALSYGHMASTSASERIQAVNQSYELTQADQDITQLLINTLNFDANVNVRLAACQALTRFENEPGVREALIQSLSIQTDPNVQITLIETLVAIKEKRAVDEMQRLVQNQRVLDVVRLKAEEGLTRLSQNQHAPS